MSNLKSKIIAKYNSNSSSIHIAVFIGGMSKERQISLSSGKEVVKELSKMNYKLTVIDVGFDIYELLKEIKPDMVFNSLHGTYGEDGCIAGLLEIMGIPYTGSGVLASSLAFDKLISQNLIRKHNITCPKRIIVKKGEYFAEDPIARPYIIKPTNQGSSVGVMTIFEGDNISINDYKFEYGDIAVVEEFIKGQEIHVAILNNEAVGTLETRPLKRRFYDSESKYSEGMTEHICPANLSRENNLKVMSLGEKIHKLFGCRGATRAEFIYDPQKDEFYFLEINTHPGMTPLSILPEICEKHGIDFSSLLYKLIDGVLVQDVREKIQN